MSEKEGMEGPLTRYLRALPGEGAVELALFEEMWDKLRGMLIGELKRRLLWTVSPAVLGIDGHSRWVSGPPSSARPEDALDDLARGAYLFLFDRSLASLSRSLTALDSGAKGSAHRDIDGSFRLQVRNFLLEEQRRRDPIGYRVYSDVRRELQWLVKEDVLAVASGSLRIRNDTVLAFVPAPKALEPAPEEALRDLCLPWAGTVLTDLILAHGPGVTKARQLLRAEILGLRKKGIESFRFSGLCRPLKMEARGRISLFFEVGPGTKGLIEVTQEKPADDLTIAGMSFETRQHFRKVAECVSRAVASAEPGAGRERLERLWAFFRQFAATDLDERELAATRLSKALAIPRNDIPRLRARLGEMVRRCRELQTALPRQANLGRQSFLEEPRNA